MVMKKAPPGITAAMFCPIPAMKTKRKESVLDLGPQAEVSLRTGGWAADAILAEDGWQGGNHK